MAVSIYSLSGERAGLKRAGLTLMLESEERCKHPFRDLRTGPQLVVSLPTDPFGFINNLRMDAVRSAKSNLRFLKQRQPVKLVGASAEELDVLQVRH